MLTLLKEQEMKKQQKQAEDKMIVKKYASRYVFLFFHASDQSESIVSAPGGSTSGAGAGCCTQWDGNTLPAHKPSWELHWEVRILIPNLH